MAENYDQFPDLEIVSLRKQVQELKQKLEQAQAVLREHDLLDAKSHVSAEEQICQQQIDKYLELSSKGIPFQIEETKQFEIFVKTLLAIRGKSVPVEKEGKKKAAKPEEIAKLLKIANGGAE